MNSMVGQIRSTSFSTCIMNNYGTNIQDGEKVGLVCMENNTKINKE